MLKKTKNREYSSEFKQAAVDRVLVNHESILQVSLSIGLLGKNQLSVWVKSYLENGYNGLKNKKRGRHAKNQETNTETEQIQALQQEILKLRIENEYLKKLDALITEREKQEQKK